MAEAVPIEIVPPRAAAAGAAPGRLRLAIYLAFALLALAIVAQAWNTLRVDALRSADAEIVERAGSQRTAIEQAGRLAALLVAEPAARERHAQALGQILASSGDEATALEGQLQRQGLRAEPSGAETKAAIDAWRAARERLAARGSALLRRAAAGEGTDPGPAAQAVQAEVGPAAAAAQRLSAALRGAAERRAHEQKQALQLGLLGVLALLALLSLTVVEPGARALRRQARRLQQQAADVHRRACVAEHTSALVAVTDREDRVLWVNAAFTQITGWTAADAAGRPAGELLAHPRADAAQRAPLQQAVAEGQGARVEGLHRSRDGRDLWLDLALSPVRDADGSLAGFVRVATDVGARVQQRDKLQALWRALPAGVVVQDGQGQIVEANRAAERLLGLTLAQMQGRDSGDPRWRAVRDDGSAYPGDEHPPMRTLASGRALRNETLGVHTPQGELRWLVVNTEPLHDAAGQLSGVVSCFGDATESRLLQDRLSSSARTDALTRLPNRAVVMERLERAIDHARRHAGYGFAVLFMDFDRFKQVNDTLGHGAGDELLRQVAERLNLALRPGDAVARLDDEMRVAARIGGDEFVVVLEGVNDAATAGHIADRLLVELAEPYLLGATPVQSSVSIGLVLSCGGETTADKVLRDADTAMYEAKRAGRGRWVMFDDSMHERVMRALAVETDLRQALQRDDELFVVYQPVVDLATRTPVGVEALVRWNHPQRGLVPPADFIDVAEESGLIDALGSFVLGAACRQFVKWRHELGALAPRYLSVNLSRAQLERGELVGEVRALLQELALHPAQLQFEITESLAAQDERVQATLRALKTLGVKLALDDFGTGYSSLACLHQLPVDTVKIDRSFVRHAETVEYHRVLIEATIRVARTLGMTTVAEGIECEGQAALMLQLECDRGQGYLYSPALAAGEIENWLRREAVVEALD